MVMLILLFTSFSFEYNNGVGKFPVMGWSSWNQFGCEVSEKLIIETMEALVLSGLRDVGYVYVNLDDCWQLRERSKDGHQVVDPHFPNGMKYLVEKAHSLGLKLGLYTDIGFETCAGRAGSFGHYQIDAQQYAEWEIDFLKVDFCFLPPDVVKQPWVYYSNFSHEMNNTKRPMIFNICNWGATNPWEWAPAISHQWRTTVDIDSSWYKVVWNMQRTAVLDEYAGLYAYNDPDMLEVGVTVGEKKLNLVENKAHFAAWCMLASPLVLGIDIRNITAGVLDIISNKELIAINQDELGQQGILSHEIQHNIFSGQCIKRADNCTYIQIFKKVLSGGDIAVMVLNRASDDSSEDFNFNEYESVIVTWDDLKIEEGSYSVRDLFFHKDLGNFEKEFSTGKLSQHDVQVIKLKKL